MLFVVIVLLLASSSLIKSQSYYDDPCHLIAWDTNTLDIPANCTSGDVDWHYPQGSLYLSTGNNYGDTYQLCIEESWFTALGGVTDLTGGRNQTLSLPTKENPVCTSALDGIVKLRLDADGTVRYYMTLFKYKIV